jgi:hypothetical protein
MTNASIKVMSSHALQMLNISLLSPGDQLTSSACFLHTSFIHHYDASLFENAHDSPTRNVSPKPASRHALPRKGEQNAFAETEKVPL